MVMLKHRHQNLGFTIVELLIVVVVIAILAAITIVAYNGVQDRATTAKTSDLATSYLKLFKMYKVQEGEIPVDGWNETYCLGPPEKYPAQGVFEAGECAVWTSHDRFSHEVDTDMNSQIAAVMGKLPEGNTSTVVVPEIEGEWLTFTNVSYRGVMYRTVETYVDEEWVQRGYIHYFLNGTKTCAQGKTFNYSGITECILAIEDNEIDEDLARSNGGEG